MAQQNFKLDVNTRDRQIRLRFPRPVQVIYLNAEMALNLAKEILLAAREIQSADEARETQNRILKEIM